MGNKFIFGVLTSINYSINGRVNTKIYNYLNKIYQCPILTIPTTHTIIHTTPGITIPTPIHTLMKLSGDHVFKQKLPNPD